MSREARVLEATREASHSGGRDTDSEAVQPSGGQVGRPSRKLCNLREARLGGQDIDSGVVLGKIVDMFWVDSRLALGLIQG